MAKPYKNLESSTQVAMSNQAIEMHGGSQAYNNMQPFVAMNFIICIDGEYPIKS